jgi:hypothetical protein
MKRRKGVLNKGIKEVRKGKWVKGRKEGKVEEGLTGEEKYYRREERWQKELKVEGKITE